MSDSRLTIRRNRGTGVHITLPECIEERSVEVLINGNRVAPTLSKRFFRITLIDDVEQNCVPLQFKGKKDKQNVSFNVGGGNSLFFEVMLVCSSMVKKCTLMVEYFLKNGETYNKVEHHSIKTTIKSEKGVRSLIDVNMNRHSKPLEPSRLPAIVNENGTEINFNPY
jgi:hypothetical protein